MKLCVPFLTSIVALGLVGCGGFDNDSDDSTAGGTAGLRFTPRFASNMWNQLDTLYGQAGAPSRSAGQVYLQICPLAGCDAPELVPIGERGLNFGSLGGPSGDVLEVGGLPTGAMRARVFLDTNYSHDVGAAVEDEGGPGNFDVFVSGGTRGDQPCTSAADCYRGSIEDGQNPEPWLLEFDLAAGETLDLGTLVFGSAVLDYDGPQPTPGRETLLVAVEADDRPELRIIDEADLSVRSAEVHVDGRPFRGELCGFVDDGRGGLYALGSDGRDGYVFGFDGSAEVLDDAPIILPGDVASARPCRGAVVHSAGRTYLVLLDVEGLGRDPSPSAFPLTIVDVTDPAAPRFEGVSVDDPIFASGSVSPILRAVAAIDGGFVALAPSWRSPSADGSDLYTFSIDSSNGRPVFTHAVAAGTADERCGEQNGIIPLLTSAEVRGETRVFVGTDDGVLVFSADELRGATADRPLDELDLREYGRLPSSAAIAPDGAALYIMPYCKSVHHAMLDGSTTNRHAAAIVDLTGDADRLAMLETERRFDDPDGGPTGGVDLAFLALDRHLKRWYSNAPTPPVVYVNAEIAAGSSMLFMRGKLGQVLHIGAFDLETGEGLIPRPGFNIWFDGPSAKWGIDLNTDDAQTFETTAFARLPQR